jgi:hypothetical protein
MKPQKKRKYTPEQRAAMFEPTYVFGYGSLLLADGINGRGMKHRYTDDELTPCVLNGYERSMCGFFGGRNFYGLLENKTASCNGIIFKIHNWYDYRAFLHSEGATSYYRQVRTYWPIRVTDKISGCTKPKGHRIMTLLCKEDKSRLGRVEKHYIALCHHGAKIWGKEFEERFLATGGIPYAKKRKELMEIVKKHNIRVW